MRRLALLTFAISMLLTSGVARAHGDLDRSDPERGDHVRKAPDAIELDFAEPPTEESRFEVTDGCKENVLASVGGEGPHAVLAIEGGAPGRWTVDYRTVSSIDGHLVEGSFGFHVGNKRPCGSPEPVPGATDGVGAAVPPNDNNGGGIPLVPIALAALGITGVAWMIRRSGA